MTDPDELLRDLRHAITMFNMAETHEQTWQAASDMADAADCLDVWLFRGGTLPSDWQRKR